MYAQTLSFAERHLRIVAKKNNGSKHTILVIGEFHYLPASHREELRVLIGSADELGLKMVGIENFPVDLKSILNYYGRPNISRALKEDRYMRRLLDNDIRAVDLFALARPEVLVGCADDEDVHSLCEKIDNSYRELFLLKRKVGLSGMTRTEKLRYEIWSEMLKNVVLRARSDAIVDNTYSVQKDMREPLAVIVIGCGHTPWHRALIPYSVVPMLDKVRVNYVITILPSIARYLKNRDPFDFYTRASVNEIDWPYEK